MLLSVSVDLDETRHYRAIHGQLGDDPEGMVFRRALPRLADWAAERRIPITWFVVGRDAEVEENRQALSYMARRGHELACHSYSHFYDLTLRSAAEMRDELERGATALRALTPDVIRGFRAPGYVVSDPLLGLASELGFAYDSSVFPCPSYYALKATAIAAHRIRGRTSSAIIDLPDALQSPIVPYRVGRPYWSRGSGILEIPIQVTRRARLPFIGTALTMAGPTGARLLARGVLGLPFVNLELHGIDALDRHDGLEELATHQPDLRIPWQKKLDAIDAAVTLLRGKGYACVRMDELAARAARA